MRPTEERTHGPSGQMAEIIAHPGLDREWLDWEREDLLELASDYNQLHKVQELRSQVLELQLLRMRHALDNVASLLEHTLGSGHKAVQAVRHEQQAAQQWWRLVK